MRHSAQESACKALNPSWVIRETPFTTMTVNYNVCGAVHKDAGDFKDGMGIITCHRRGVYRGGVLGFPEYGLGVELFDRDLLFFNPHDWHGVTDFVDAQDGFERISVVYYMRADMAKCGSPEEELERVRLQKGAI